jgi:hypothetical protein
MSKHLIIKYLVNHIISSHFTKSTTIFLDKFYNFNLYNVYVKENYQKKKKKNL